MAIKTYNPRRVSLKWKGIELVDDIPDGEFIAVAKGADAWALAVGNDGVAVRIKQNNRSAVISLSVRRSSDINRQLMAIAAKDEITEAEVGAMVCSDPSGPASGSGFVAHDAFILAVPNFARATAEVGVAVWRWACSRIDEAELGIAITQVTT